MVRQDLPNYPSSGLNPHSRCSLTPRSNPLANRAIWGSDGDRTKTEQIKRANRLYTNESIFLKECLRIPVPKQEVLQKGSRAPDQAVGSSAPTFEPLSAELSPSDFLKRLDSQITQSKAAAIRKLSDGAGR
ncbi:hypothetical protein chiPu_0027702 [Chiloscyllium punctatum]|uniref:LysM domain-containing protein n=1 Tax=Chiloscyllium punctatum TaxID=137246 RepID=A0A401TM46_CHIPU|nr:hypothetical protein [Chiloscyllium punctatum]